MPAGASSSSSANEQMGTPAARMSMVKLGLMRGPPKGVDPDGCGRAHLGGRRRRRHAGRHRRSMGRVPRWRPDREHLRSAVSGGHAARELLSERPGRVPMRGVEEGARAFQRLDVTREQCGGAEAERPKRARRSARQKAPPRFEQHEEAAIQALAFAGDFHKGTKGTNRFY